MVTEINKDGCEEIIDEGHKMREQNTQKYEEKRSNATGDVKRVQNISVRDKVKKEIFWTFFCCERVHFVVMYCTSSSTLSHGIQSSQRRRSRRLSRIVARR